MSGYRVRCTVCGRETTSGPSPLTGGWPKCCGYTMRLEDTERFIADVDDAMAEAFAPARASRRGMPSALPESSKDSGGAVSREGET